MSGMRGALAQPWRRARGGRAAAQRGRGRPGRNIEGASARARSGIGECACLGEKGHQVVFGGADAVAAVAVPQRRGGLRLARACSGAGVKPRATLSARKQLCQNSAARRAGRTPKHARTWLHSTVRPGASWPSAACIAAAAPAARGRRRGAWIGVSRALQPRTSERCRALAAVRRSCRGGARWRGGAAAARAGGRQREGMRLARARSERRARCRAATAPLAPLPRSVRMLARSDAAAPGAALTTCAWSSDRRALLPAPPQGRPQALRSPPARAHLLALHAMRRRQERKRRRQQMGCVGFWRFGAGGPSRLPGPI
jgi:hypothetical protein